VVADAFERFDWSRKDRDIVTGSQPSDQRGVAESGLGSAVARRLIAAGVRS
jgi:hypothetical protein